MFHSALLKKTLELCEGNNQLHFMFHGQRFCQGSSSEYRGGKYICTEDRLSDVLFSDPFLKKRSDHEYQKSGFRFDLKNPLEVWILWIHDPFLDGKNDYSISIPLLFSVADGLPRARVLPHFIKLLACQQSLQIRDKHQIVLDFGILETLEPRKMTRGLKVIVAFKCPTHRCVKYT